MTKLRQNFEIFKKNVNIFDKPLDELLWLFYKQGNLDPAKEEQEVSNEELKKIVEDEYFFDFIKNCLEHPENMTPAIQDECVEVSYPCGGHDKCVAWPDRCEECGGDGITCGKKIINLSKLCRVPSVKETLTKEEVDILADMLAKTRE